MNDTLEGHCQTKEIHYLVLDDESGTLLENDGNLDGGYSYAPPSNLPVHGVQGKFVFEFIETECRLFICPIQAKKQADKLTKKHKRPFSVIKMRTVVAEFQIFETLTN